MDIRFIAAIFIIAALMEMLAKMARKRRGEEEIEEPEAPRIADPLAGVVEQMRRLSGGDEDGREVGPEASERVVRERRSPGGDDLMPHASPERAPEPVTLRGQIERMFEPMPQPPPAPVVAPEPPPRTMAVVPRGDVSPRPVEVRSREVRSREVRPREARDLVERTWTEERRSRAGEPTIPAGGGGRRLEPGWGGKGGGLPIGSVRGLRRLVVAREVLGPPLALRGEERFPNG